MNARNNQIPSRQSPKSGERLPSTLHAGGGVEGLVIIALIALLLFAAMASSPVAAMLLVLTATMVIGVWVLSKQPNLPTL